MLTLGPRSFPSRQEAIAFSILLGVCVNTNGPLSELGRSCAHYEVGNLVSRVLSVVAPNMLLFIPAIATTCLAGPIAFQSTFEETGSLDHN
jgi:hypothetical protein